MEITIITLIFTGIIAPIITYKIGQRKSKDDFQNIALQNRYKLLYCPLRTSLLETHITGASMGFSLNQRIERALPYFKKLKIRQGFIRLSKKFGANPLYEVEFGKEFPMDEIIGITKKNSKWADAKLLNLVQRADRSTYEARNTISDPLSYGLLENEKYELAAYIWNNYEKLNKRLLPK